MILIATRLLMPPGICACKWSAPAARFLAALTQGERPFPNEEERDDDDHEPGCPASPLAVGMGVKPPSEPLLPPSLALEPSPPPQSMPAFLSVCTETATPFPFAASPTPLYLTVRALLL
jgi:hypothetical protein